MTKRKKQILTGFISYNVMNEDGDVLMPGCFDKSLEKFKIDSIILNNHDKGGLTVVQSFDLSEVSLMPDGTMAITMRNVKFK